MTDSFHIRHTCSLEALKSPVVMEWDAVPLQNVWDSCKAFHGHLEQVIKAKGCQFESIWRRRLSHTNILRIFSKLRH